MAKHSGKISSAALGALTNQNQSNSGTPEQTIQNPLAAISNKMKNSEVLEPEFTGIARSVICRDNQGFKNFQIATLYIEKGKVVKMDLSDMWANFETAAILEHVSHVSMININNHWEDGKAFTE